MGDVIVCAKGGKARVAVLKLQACVDGHDRAHMATAECGGALVGTHPAKLRVEGVLVEGVRP